MFDKKRMSDLHKALSEWEKSTLAETVRRTPERQEKFIIASS